MLVLAFNQRQFPRTIGKSEWREIDRWRRVTSRNLAVTSGMQLSNLAILRSFRPELYALAIERIINPPIVVHPKQEFA